jgi:hypothetical protein
VGLQLHIHSPPALAKMVSDLRHLLHCYKQPASGFLLLASPDGLYVPVRRIFNSHSWDRQNIILFVLFLVIVCSSLTCTSFVSFKSHPLDLPSHTSPRFHTPTFDASSTPPSLCGGFCASSNLCQCCTKFKGGTVVNANAEAHKSHQAPTQ